jgi:predicted esterase
MKYSTIILITAAFLLSSCGKETDPRVKKISEIRGYENFYIDSFRCGVFVPLAIDKNKEYPLIIFLHGYTDTTTWNLPWYKEPIVSNDPCIVLTPKCPKEDPYGWGDSFDPRTPPMMEKTYEMIELVKKSFHIDPERYYIYGSSMGGRGTYGAIQKNPGLFAAAYVECGYPNIAIAQIIAEMPFWIFHGSVDNIVPIQPTRDLYKAVLELGGKQIRYTEYKGVGHNVWDNTGKETTLTTWLLAQRKGSVHNAPETPEHFTGKKIDDKRILLQWEIPGVTFAPSDNNVWFCRIYRNDTILTEVYNNLKSYTDSSFLADNSINYSISAVNYYFKESKISASVTFSDGF